MSQRYVHFRSAFSSSLFGSALVAIGCSGQPSRLAVTEIDSGAAAAAIAQFDTNGDGVLDEGEIDQAPSLKAALTRVDTSGDRKLDEQEIQARIDAWRDSKVGLMPVVIRLKLGGSPLAGAEVTLIPEAFLGEALKSAKGTTDQDGMAVMQISEARDERGVQPGFYRVTVSKQPSGSETIPSRYNSQTQLGLEVEPISPDSRDATFSLTR